MLSKVASVKLFPSDKGQRNKYQYYFPILNTIQSMWIVSGKVIITLIQCNNYLYHYYHLIVVRGVIKYYIGDMDRTMDRTMDSSMDRAMVNTMDRISRSEVYFK